VVDLISGQVNMNFDTMPPVLPHIKEGQAARAGDLNPPAAAATAGRADFNEVVSRFRRHNCIR